MRTSDTTAELFAALAKAQAEITPPTKSKTANAGTYTYTYADLADVIAACRKPLDDNDLAIVQEDVTDHEHGAGVTTRIVHRSGEWLEAGPLWLPAKPDAQGIGSALSYARRYAYTAALGIAAEDDDGAASKPAPAKAAPKATEAAMKRLHVLARSRGVTHEQMRDWAGRHLGIESLTELTQAGAKEMEQSLKELPEVEVEGATDA